MVATFIKSLFFALVILFIQINSILAAQLTKTEEEIVSYINDEQPEALKLLERVVNINSGTMNFKGVKKVGLIFSRELESIGFKTKWIDGAPFNRAGHLVASYGNKGKKFLLIGHLDTVFAKNSEFKAYKNINKRLVAGPGITDMKGGDVVIISVLKALKSSGVLENLQVKVILTGDEEKRGTPYDVATKELIAAGKWADIALGFEDGDGNPKTAVVSRRGSTGWQLKVTGRAAHSSQIFRDEYGDGAIFEAARILTRFREKLSKEPNLTFNPGVIVGGTKVKFDKDLAQGTAFGKNNVIAQSTIVNGDIRALSPQQLKKAQSAMKRIVAESLNKTAASIEFFFGYPPMAPSNGNRAALSVYNQTSKDLGFGEVSAVDPRKAGAADISFVANHVDMALDGIGLMGTGGHTVKEVADIATLSSQTKRASVVIYRLSKIEK